MNKAFIVLSLLAFNTLIIHFPVRAEDHLIFINEFLPDGTGTDAGKEWVELYNLSESAVNLKDWKISTKSTTSTTPRSISIPDVSIKPKSFLIISEFEETSNIEYINVGSGKLNMYNSNAEIYLSDSLGNKVDNLSYLTAQEGKSFERRGPIVSQFCNELQISSSGTMGNNNSLKDNSCWPVDQSDTPVEPIPDPLENTIPQVPPSPEEPISNVGLQSSIVISEVYPSPNKNNSEKEWIEIYNQDILDVDLSGMYLKERAGDGLSNSKSFLPNLRLVPGGYLVVYEEDLNISLNNTGDSIFLLDANDTIVDNFKFANVVSSNTSARKYVNNQYVKKYNSDENLNFVPLTSIPTPGGLNRFPEPKSLGIQDLKLLEANDYIKTAGIINSQINLVDKSYLYIQDYLSGIKVFFNLDHSKLLLKEGMRIELIGHIQYDSDNEIYIAVRNLSDVQTFEALPETEYINITQVDNLEQYVGVLSYFEGEIYKNYKSSFYITSNNINIKVRVPAITNITLPAKSTGDWVEVKGLLIKEGDIFTIIPRYSVDLKFISESIDSNKMLTLKNSDHSTLPGSKILGQSYKATNLISYPNYLGNAGDRLYSLDSPTTQDDIVYAWPIYLTSASMGLLEFLKTLSRVIKYF